MTLKWIAKRLKPEAHHLLVGCDSGFINGTGARLLITAVARKLFVKYGRTHDLRPRRGGGARGTCGKRRALVFARLLGGGAATRRTQPRLSSFQTAPGSSPSVWAGVGHRGEPTPAERNRKNGLHARPHPGPLPQERGRRARFGRVLGIEESLRRRSGIARMDYTLALTPALSPRRGAGVWQKLWGFGLHFLGPLINFQFRI